MASNLHVQPEASNPSPDAGLLITIFEAVPFAVALVDATGLLLHLNRTYREDWGGEHARSLADLVQPEHREAVSALLLGGSAGTTISEPLRMLQAGMDERWAQLTLSPAPDKAGSPSLLAVSFADVTRLKQQITELALLESRWNNALVSSTTGVWDHNWATGDKYYSPTWRRIRGMSLDDPLPESTAAWLDLLHPDDRQHVIHCMERQNAGDPDYAVFEYRERHKDGHWVWIECRGDCVAWDDTGKPVHIIGTDTDITSRKTAEEAAARMSRRLDMALEISGVGVYECDLTTGSVDWDDRMFRIYRLPAREDVKVGGLWESFLHPDDAQRVVETVDTHVANGTRFSDQYRVILRDGTERVIRARTMSFVDRNGHDMTVGANWDVTDDVSLHRELERAKTLAEARNGELEAAKARIEHIAMHDYLTALPNRRYLDQVLDRLDAQCRDTGGGLAVLHVDLDSFKQINDTLGHQAGDAVLQHVACILRSALSTGDFAARIGGDEFVIVIGHAMSRQSLAALATRLIEGLRQPFAYEGSPCRIGASIGIASGHGMSLDVRQLLRDSDAALYRAKTAGRSRYAFFEAD